MLLIAPPRPELRPQPWLRDPHLGTLPDALLALRAGPAAPWLRYDHSITGQLRATRGVVTVTPLREGFGRPSALEAALLAAPGLRCAWLREITLAAGGEVMLHARTVVPKGASNLLPALRGLGRRPLGELLFLGRALRAGVTREHRCAFRNAAGGWLRATTYRVQGDPLLVLESPTIAAMDLAQGVR